MQYYLYLIDNGLILSNELQAYINSADPIKFITVTKPSLKPKAYKAFANWVQRRKRANKDNLKDIAK